jgi:lysophospholipase L1-like esterase
MFKGFKVIRQKEERIMKKKAVMALMACVIATVPLTGCAKRSLSEIIAFFSDEDSTNEGSDEETPIESDSLQEQMSSTEEMQIESDIDNETESSLETDLDNDVLADEEQSETSAEPESELSEIEKLTPGELEARKTQQANFEEARQTLYGLPNSKDKTLKIDQMDRQIIANNSYDFSKKRIVFIGDSITEGIMGAVTSHNRHISYTDYVQSNLHFSNCLNHGKGGMLFSYYGGDEMSIDYNFDNVTNIDSDVIVVFAGINDYLCASDNKRFGNIDDTVSTAGYCGSVRSFMKKLQRYYSDRDVFFVMMYDVMPESDPNYSDVTGELTLNDYLDVQRKLANEYGFNVIDLYSIGYMDCTDAESEEYFLNDSIHPNDTGNIMLGEHIAAELSLYFSQR